MTIIPSLRLVDPSEIPTRHFTQHLADCLILTHDHKILMQLRPENWGKWAGVLNTFGGHVEDGESVAEGLVRELHEELGALVDFKDIIFLGAVTEDFTTIRNWSISISGMTKTTPSPAATRRKPAATTRSRTPCRTPNSWITRAGPCSRHRRGVC
jgi:8-oxo-dGTP pyrophosphatase MutT (NUDIX family)